ncbi:MAG: hypothetical protein U0670_10865 [Anaerolineae bacterium]
MRIRHSVLWVFVCLIVLGIPFYQVRADACPYTGNDQATAIIFENRSPYPVEAYWIDYDCNEVYYDTIPPGQTYDQPTYDAHTWVLRSETSGEELARGTAYAGIDVVLVAYGFAYHPTAWDWQPIEDSGECHVRPVTPEDHLDPFYEQMCDYQGIPIASTSNVPPEALQAAWLIIANMMQGLPDVVGSFQANHLLIAIVGEHEGITEIPEYAFLRTDPNTDWNARSRGFGASPQVPVGSGAEENLLCYASDAYHGESIFLHEFAHTIKDMGIALLDPSFTDTLTQAYQNAIADGLWENTYAASTVEEYWAEGVQDYFNTNLQAIPSNGIHNQINTRSELRDYDPGLYAIIDAVFGGFEWTPSCP